MQKTKRWIIAIASIFVVLILIYFFIPKAKGFAPNKNDQATINPSIAVVPFVSLDSNGDQQYFSEGLTEEIVSALSQIKDLKVSANGSSSKFRENKIDVQEIGSRLGVHSILTGTVRRFGNRLEIMAELMSTDDSVPLWSARYNENEDDIFAIQSRIVHSIAEKLELTLLGGDNQGVPKKPTTSAAAHDLYMKGRSLWNKRSKPNLQKAIGFFNQALEIDTAYAAAYSGIADCYNALGYGSYLEPKDAFPKARDAAKKAILLDSSLSEPHASLGFYDFYYNWDWAEAEQEFRTAIALNRNYALAYEWYGYYLTSMQRFSEARTIFQKAESIDPLSANIRTDIGFSAYYSGDYDFAIRQLQASLQLDSNLPLTRIWLGRSYQAKQMYPQSIDQYNKMLTVTRNWPVGLAQIGSVYGVSGNQTDAKKIRDTLLALSSKVYVTSYGMALVCIGLGEKEETFRWLDLAYGEKTHWLVWLKGDPRWIPIRNDKRFSALVHRVGLPD
jgi:TolB-like protein